MDEAAVALTDYALTIETAVLAASLWRARSKGNQALARWFTLFFAAVSLSSLLAGTFHGFFADERTLPGKLLWRSVMLTVGVIAVAGASAAGCLWPPAVRRAVTVIAGVAFVAYCGAVLFITQEYRWAIVVYLPATVFLLLSFVVSFARMRTPGLLAGAAGLLLTFVAAGVQQSSLAVTALHLDHNALYHIVQAFALVLVYLGARASVRSRERKPVCWASGGNS